IADGGARADAATGPHDGLAADGAAGSPDGPAAMDALDGAIAGDSDAAANVAARRGRLALGEDFSCALDRQGRPICWGTVVASAVPARGGFTAISAGVRHVCARDQAGA